ncbi:hypothetical protein MNBD_UNCLBAC01-1401 [hydrothermal vent metagenome]|uniref:RelE-like translational repressor toxin n=1 Tax=hydrothermal vent metagenome TaxID=652676 RepID=A0A3B1DK65_9ZZZZ
MEIIEAPIFTKKIEELISSESYRELQSKLIVDPHFGNVISGGNGIRKLRWSFPGKGKRGGIRVVYYWMGKENIIYMIIAYKKSEKEDLTKDQLKQIALYVKGCLL